MDQNTRCKKQLIFISHYFIDFNVCEEFLYLRTPSWFVEIRWKVEVYVESSWINGSREVGEVGCRVENGKYILLVIHSSFILQTHIYSLFFRFFVYSFMQTLCKAGREAFPQEYPTCRNSHLRLKELLQLSEKRRRHRLHNHLIKKKNPVTINIAHSPLVSPEGLLICEGFPISLNLSKIINYRCLLRMDSIQDADASCQPCSLIFVPYSYYTTAIG